MKLPPTYFMNRCIQLAKLARGNTAENPMVGAVLVFENNIIGEGFHQKYGGAHAEVNCLKSVNTENIKNIPHATMFVNLEPCNHTGKTPPCTTAILDAGIKNVVLGTADKNPLVASKGIAKLQENKVQVTVGVLEKESYKLNKVFFTNQKFKRAFIKIKWAETANGFIGQPSNQLSISNEQTNIISHKFRTRVDGILVGFNTAKNDAPKLNARYWQGKQPARIFIDWACDLPQEIIATTGQRNIVLNTIKNENKNGVEFVQVEKTASAIAEKLLELRICSILVEGGAKTHELFLSANCWDEAIVIQGTAIIDAGIAAAKITKGKLLSRKSIGHDIISHISYSPFLT